MVATVGALETDMRLRVAKFNRDLNKAQQQVKNQTRKMNRSFKRTENRVQRLAKAMRALRGAAVAMAVIGFAVAVKRNIELASSLGKTADKVGVTVEELQQLRFMAERVGVDTKTLDLAIQRFSRRLGEAAQGTGELLPVLKQYNIQTKNADGTTRSVTAVLRDLADVTKNAKGSQEQLRISFKAFDSEGAALVNLMRQGAIGIDEFAKRAEELGIIIGEESVRAAEKLDDKWTDLSASFSAAATEASVNLIPAMSEITDSLNSGALRTGLKNLTEGLNSLIIGFFNFAESARDTDSFIENFNRSLDLGRNPFQAFADAIVTTGEAARALKEEPPIETEDLIDPNLGEDAGDAANAFEKFNKVFQDLQLQAALASPAVTDIDRQVFALAKSAGLAEDEIEELVKQFVKLGTINNAELLSIKFALEEIARRKDAAQVIEQTKTAQERFNEEIERLNELRPHLTMEQYARAVKMAQDNLDAANEAQIKLTDEQQRLKDVTQETGSALTDSLREAIIEGKSFGEVLKSLEQRLLDIASNLIIEKPFENFLGGLFKGDGSTLGGGGGGGGNFIQKGLGFLANILHDGGIVGGAAPSRAVSASAFKNAKKFQFGGLPGIRQGLGSQEVAAILHRGEMVLPASLVNDLRSSDPPPAEGGVTMNVFAKDAPSFRESRGQIASDLSFASEKARRNR